MRSSSQSDSGKEGAEAVINATVSSAIPLTTSEKQKLSSILTGVVGSAVSINVRTNEKLLGGMKIEVGDWSIDTSLTRQLQDLAVLLKES